jgi:phage-related protein
MMKKIIRYDDRALVEFEGFSKTVRKVFLGLIDVLAMEGRLDFPTGKRINSDLFEIRVRKRGQYRGVYAYLVGNSVIILHFFQKKSQKMPIKDIKTSIKRLQRYEIHN